MVKRLSNLIKKLLGKNDSTPNEVQLNASVIKQLIHAIQNTQEEELVCDNVFEIVDQYVELTLQGADTRELMPLVYHHLEMCHDCKEEYETLLSILKTTPQ